MEMDDAIALQIILCVLWLNRLLSSSYSLYFVGSVLTRLSLRAAQLRTIGNTIML